MRAVVRPHTQEVKISPYLLLPTFRTMVILSGISSRLE